MMEPEDRIISVKNSEGDWLTIECGWQGSLRDLDYGGDGLIGYLEIMLKFFGFGDIHLQYSFGQDDSYMADYLPNFEDYREFLRQENDRNEEND